MHSVTINIIKYIKIVQNARFIALIYQSFCNIKQLLEAATKCIYITHLKAFQFE